MYEKDKYLTHGYAAILALALLTPDPQFTAVLRRSLNPFMVHLYPNLIVYSYSVSASAPCYRSPFATWDGVDRDRSEDQE